MTYTRSAKQQYSLSPDQVSPYVRQVAAQTKSYKSVKEVTPTSFRIKVKPNILLLSTKMLVDLQPEPGGTLVTVTTKSQWYIMGDAFGMYDRFIDDFFKSLKAAVERGDSLAATVGAIEDNTKLNLSNLIYAIGILVAVPLILLVTNFHTLPALILVFLLGILALVRVLRVPHR